MTSKQDQAYRQGQGQQSLWQNGQFKAYLGSTAMTGSAHAMQQVLASWLLVGILLLPADQVGLIQAIMGLPGIVLMLWGGASADRADARMLLMRAYGISWLFPLVLMGTVEIGYLNLWSVTLFGIAISTVFSFTAPAQQALLNRTAGKDVQRGVTVATAIGFVTQMIGLALAGQMETIGLGFVLAVQAASLGLGALAVARIAPLATDEVVAAGADATDDVSTAAEDLDSKHESLPEVTDVPGATNASEAGGAGALVEASTAGEVASARRQSTLAIILDGLKVCYRDKTIFNTLVINFVSSVFNAGAFMTVVPFIVKRVYDGDALNLATILIVFYGGATISNIIQFRIMPLAQPGLWFLLMQGTRAIILVFLWIEPSWWLLMVVLFVWGLNMGVTTTLSRSLVQESATRQYLARILSVYTLGLMGSMPIGALMMGLIIEQFGTLNALIPSIIVSALLCLYGFLFTDVWRYVSPGWTTAKQGVGQKQGDP